MQAYQAGGFIWAPAGKVTSDLSLDQSTLPTVLRGLPHVSQDPPHLILFLQHSLQGHLAASFALLCKHIRQEGLLGPLQET